MNTISVKINSQNSLTHTHWTLHRSTCVSMYPKLKNWRILSEQSFTAHMPSKMATSALTLGRRHYLHHLCSTSEFTQSTTYLQK